MESSDRWIDLYCGIKRNKLLIEIENPYAGSVTMEDGLPVTAEAGHGYGCRSIRAIVLQHGGLYTFSPETASFPCKLSCHCFQYDTKRKSQKSTSPKKQP